MYEIEKCGDYSLLPENTPLQKLLKQELLKNKEFKIGWGKLKYEL